MALPILSGTLGPDVVDIRDINKLGVFTYDPAFTATASCISDITFIDGDAGLLYYRGYPIEQLAEHCSFLEVAFLLLNGELPTQDELDEWNCEVMRHTMIHENLKKFMDGFHHDAHPMGILLSTVAALSPFYPDGRNRSAPACRRQRDAGRVASAGTARMGADPEGRPGVASGERPAARAMITPNGMPAASGITNIRKTAATQAGPEVGKGAGGCAGSGVPRRSKNGPSWVGIVSH